MGAAAVIYYQGRYLTKKNVTAPRLDACVLDSPYADFGELARHLVAQNSKAATGGLGKYVAGFTVTSCVEIKILRRVRAESSRRPPRHRRDACSMAWRCRFLTARPSQDGRVVAEK